MRFLVLSIGLGICVLGAAWAQSSSDAPSQTVPVGQTFRNFEFPIYQDGQMKAKLTASQATGITQNRADTKDLKIEIYDNAVVTTTITSPDADLYAAEQKMRTSHTVQIERADMEATSDICDFDLKTKKYVLRTNVKVTLKNFDPGKSLGSTPASSPSAPATPSPTTNATDAPSPATSSLLTPRSLLNTDSLPESPGTVSLTNSAPISPSSPDSK
jgi:hypothetical protein